MAELNALGLKLLNPHKVILFSGVNGRSDR